MTDPTPSAATEQVFRLMYRSRDLIPADGRKVELGRLFTEARSNNKKQGITGALLLSEDRFVQVLEGDEGAVRALFTHIERDARHDSVSVLESGTVPQRLFARWAMAKVAEDGEPDIPLIAHVEGIAPAAGRGTTPEQEQVLDVMRRAARHEHTV
jgi:hypothetical protein